MHRRPLAAIARSVSAIARERGAVEDELLWVLVTVRADIYRRARPPRCNVISAIKGEPLPRWTAPTN
jgi:hypothetical protein